VKILGRDKDKREFRKAMEANVQYFMPFYPDLGAFLDYPLRFLRAAEIDQGDHISEEKEMQEAVRTPVPGVVINTLGVRRYGKYDKLNQTSSKPRNLAKLIRDYSKAKDPTLPSIIITGNAGSGK
ncbi:uncharacterized protein METZ01_LOCUS385687, partial [marine metagenome]